jgi:hypothetical protein
MDRSLITKEKRIVDEWASIGRDVKVLGTT